MKAAAAAEDFPALEPAEEDELVGRRDVEMLAVHLLVLELDLLRQPGRDRVPGCHDPEPLALVGVAPLEVAAGAHQAHEDLGEMRRMEHDQAHAVKDARLDAVDHGVLRPQRAPDGPTRAARRSGRARRRQARARARRASRCAPRGRPRAAAPRASRGCRPDRWRRTAGFERSWRNSFQTVTRSAVIGALLPAFPRSAPAGRPPWPNGSRRTSGPGSADCPRRC